MEYCENVLQEKHTMVAECMCQSYLDLKWKQKNQVTYTYNTVHNSINLKDFKQRIYLRTFTLHIFNPLKSRLTITTSEIWYGQQQAAQLKHKEVLLHFETLLGQLSSEVPWELKVLWTSKAPCWGREVRKRFQVGGSSSVLMGTPQSL